MDVPQYQKPPDDPALAILQQQSQQQQTMATQQSAQMDTARLMAIYGTRLAMSGNSTGSPLLSQPAFGAGGRMAA